MNNRQSFTRPISAKKIQRQIQEGIAEMQCDSCEGCDIFDSCAIGQTLLFEELKSQAHAEFYNYGLVEDPFDLGPGEEFFEVFSSLDIINRHIFNEEITPFEMAEVELGMIKYILMLNPANTGLSQEELDAMVREEYLMCRN